MEIKLPWGRETLSLQVPDTWNMHFPKAPAGPKEKQAAKGGELKAVRDALAKPVQSPPLSKMKLKGKKIVIIVDDNTRPTPAHLFFHLVLDALKKGGADMKNVLLIPALGIHTPLRVEEMADKVGVKNLKRISWENHDAFNREKNHYFGQTRRGTPMWLNRHLADAGLVVLIGLVEPHLWAGFGGGLKNIMPGVAFAETIGAHHPIIAEPPYLFNRVGMMPENNSFRQDLEEVQGMIAAPVFCLNVVLGAGQKILAGFAGDPVACHRAAIEFNKRISGRFLDRQVDAVITNSYPMDINAKQGMKCVGNTLPALKPGGLVMGFIRAERGIDDFKPPEDSKPLWLVKLILRTLGPSRVYGFLEKIKKGLNVEEKFFTYYTMQLMRQYDLYLHMPTLSEDVVKRLGFFVHSYDPQGVIDMAARRLKKDAHVAVFPEGGGTFPIIRG